MKTQFSVVIPTYNRITLLKEAIASIRSQIFKAEQIIVVDDGSDDKTVEWCNSQADIRVLKTNRLGPAAARNTGVQFCNHEWIAFLDSDDVWNDDHLDNAAKIIEENPGCSAIICNFTLTDAQLNSKLGLQGFVGAFPAFRSSHRLFSALFPFPPGQSNWHGRAHSQALFGNWLQPSGLIIRRSLFNALDGFNQGLWRCEDMDFLLRLVTRTEVTLSLKPSYQWRQQQSDSLAADQYALRLKKDGAKIMVTRGLTIVKNNPTFIFLWCASVLWMYADLGTASLLRAIRKWERTPLPQTLLQSTITLFNICVPILLGRWLSRDDFAQYRTFALYLSSVAALSLTSGLWSLVPFWCAREKDGQKQIEAAWFTLCIASILVSVFTITLAPIRSHPQQWQLNMSLAVASACLLPSIFLEQRFTALHRGLTASSLVTIVEATKTTIIIILATFKQSLAAIIFMVPIFLFVRMLSLVLLARRISPIKLRLPPAIEIWTIIKVTLPLGLSAALISLSAIADRIFLLNRLTPSEFAAVAAGTLSFPIASLLEQNSVQHSLRQLAIFSHEKRFHEASLLMRTNIERISKFTIPYCAILGAFAPEIIEILFAGKYRDATNIMRVFALSHLNSCIPPDALSRAQGLSKRILFFSFGSALITLSSLWTGFVSGGVLGAITGGIMGGLMARLIFLFSDLKRNDLKISSVLPSFSITKDIIYKLLLVASLRILSIQMQFPASITIVMAGFVLFLIIRQTLFASQQHLNRVKET